MSASHPLTVVEWREFLSEYSSKFLNSDYLRRAEAEGRARFMLSEAQREAGWLGSEPASEEAVRAAEERIGVRLPPTYRNFLLASDGWTCIGQLDLLKVDEIGWFADLDPDLLDSWAELDVEEFEDSLQILKRCLLISHDDGGSGGNWLLHADSAGENGEWTAYEWWPGDGENPVEKEDFAAMFSNEANDL